MKKKYGLLITLFPAFIFTCSCNNKRFVSSIEKFKVYKVDSVNNYYLVYAQKSNNYYKIVSKKQSNPKGTNLIRINGFYDFDLVSLWNQEILINGINVAPSTTFNVTCLGFDDSTSICLEKDSSIYDLFVAKNLNGLHIIKKEGIK